MNYNTLRPLGIGLMFAILTACGDAVEVAEVEVNDEPTPVSAPGDPQNTLYLELKNGQVVIDMLPDVAPIHVARIKELVSQEYYDGLEFHRVIEGFMAQTGDPSGTGGGGSGQTLAAEFSDTPHNRGTVSMARKQDPDSADSQFFIVYAPARHLDGKYTVWGQVRSGMELVDNIKKGGSRGGQVKDPDIMISLRLAADID